MPPLTRSNRRRGKAGKMAIGDPAEKRNAPTGNAVDSAGFPVKDPTANVLDLVRAAIERQDDLREAESRHIRQLAAIRADYDVKMREADREQAHLRAGYEEKLRTQESARIDAIRAVDVGAVSRAAEVSAAQAGTLATQQQASADALRNQVEQARIATAEALAQALAPITKSIEDLRAAQYQQQGEKSSRVETSTTDRDDLAIEQARFQAEQTRLQASQARMQMYALVIAAIVVAIGLYTAFHK